MWDFPCHQYLIVITDRGKSPQTLNYHRNSPKRNRKTKMLILVNFYGCFLVSSDCGDKVLCLFLAYSTIFIPSFFKTTNNKQQQKTSSSY